MAYPTKLRERATQALKSGYKRDEATKMFGLGVHTLRAWEKLEAETNSLEKRELKREPYKINSDKLLEYYHENPLSANQEAAAAFNRGVSGIRSAKKRLKITRKKNDTIRGA